MTSRKRFIMTTTFTAAALGGIIALVGPDRIINGGIKAAVRGLSLLEGKVLEVEQNLQGRQVAVLVAEGFEDTEITEPAHYLEERGAEVVLVARETGKYTGKRGEEVTATRTLEEIDIDNYDGLLIPGGYAPDKLRREEKVLQLVKEFYEKGKPIAAICHGPQVLISAGLLGGKRVTGYSGIKEELEEAGAHYEDAQVVQLGNLIMSRHPMDIPAFSRTFAAELKEQ